MECSDRDCSLLVGNHIAHNQRKAAIPHSIHFKTTVSAFRTRLLDTVTSLVSRVLTSSALVYVAWDLIGFNRDLIGMVTDALTKPKALST